jgi:hypothetical protein
LKHDDSHVDDADKNQSSEHDDGSTYARALAPRAARALPLELIVNIDGLFITTTNITKHVPVATAGTPQTETVRTHTREL